MRDKKKLSFETRKELEWRNGWNETQIVWVEYFDNVMSKVITSIKFPKLVARVVTDVGLLLLNGKLSKFPEK